MRVSDIPARLGCYAFVHLKSISVLSNNFISFQFLFYIHDSSLMVLPIVLKATKIYCFTSSYSPVEKKRGIAFRSTGSVGEGPTNNEVESGYEWQDFCTLQPGVKVPGGVGV